MEHLDSPGRQSVNSDSAFTVIPPYLLKELARRNPDNPAFLATYNETKNLMAGRGTIVPVQTLHEDFHGQREVYDAKHRRTIPGDRARFEAEPATDNDTVDKAYDFTGIVREFYLKEFGRNSIDGKGMKMTSTVNFGINYENAFWSGSQMVYGSQNTASPFQTFMLLDICGHEITHGVNQHESNMEYYGESGALNESMSDVFGELIQQYAKNQKAEDAEWLVGEGIWKDSINGRALRDMLHPGTAYDDPRTGKDPQPAHMKDYVKTWGDDDNGGVHYNSGIPNRAFALFARSVGGYAWEAPGQIWYQAMKNAGKNPSFADFARTTLSEAEKLGKPELTSKLKKAWQEVGVI